MATSERLEYLAAMNWLRPCELGELAPDAPETALLVERWRLRRGGSWKRTACCLAAVAGAFLVCRLLASHLLGGRSGDSDTLTPVVTLVGMMAGFMTQSWWVQRQESRHARQWTSRIGRDSADRVEDLLGRRVIGAAALAMAAQAVAIAAVIAEHGGEPGAVMLFVAAVLWVVSIVRARAAAARPMIAIDDRTRTVDDWIRLTEVRESVMPGLLGSVVLLVDFSVPTQPAIALGVITGCVVLAVGTERGRDWLNGWGAEQE